MTQPLADDPSAHTPSNDLPTAETVPTYSTAERDRRWDLARAFMEREGLDALLVHGEHEDAGPAPFAYDTWFTNERAGMAVVLPRVGEPVALFPMDMYPKGHLEAERRGDRMWLPARALRAGRDSGTVVRTLDELGLRDATVGVLGLDAAPPWNPEGIMPYHHWNRVLEQLPDAEFRDVGMAFAHLIMPLGTEELAMVRHSAHIGDTMARAMVEAAAPGVLESEVYAAGMAAGYARGTTPAAMHFWTGPTLTARGLPPWSYRAQAPRVLQDGDIVSAEVFSNFGGRHTQNQVTICVGEPHPDLLRAAQVARDAYDACLGAFRPGRTFGDVVGAGRAVLEAADGWELGPSTHAINPLIALSGFPGDSTRNAPGAEAYEPEPDHPTVNADLVLEPGMTFVIEPNYLYGRHLAYLGGTVIVGDDGAIELSPYTAQILRAPVRR